MDVLAERRAEGGSMIVTVVCDVLGEENNGTTVAAMNLIRALKAKGHTVRVLCGDEERRGGEGFYIAPKLNLWPFNGYVAKVGVSLAKGDPKIIAEAFDGTDLVHIMTPFSLGMKAMKVAEQMGIPVTAGFHCQAENMTAYVGLNKVGFLSHFVYAFLYRRFFRYADAIHYPSAFIREVFESSIRKKTRGYVISNGVNGSVRRAHVERPAEWRDRIVIVSTGRYSREKAQDVLIKAVQRAKHRDTIQLVLAGQGPQEPYYRALAKRLPIPPVFRFYERTEIGNVLNCCDLYVHPAEMELEGIACLEAIKCGKLTIVSDSKLSATRTFAVDDRCVFRRGSAKDLARVIDWWIDHPEERALCEERYAASDCAVGQEVCMAKMEQMFLEVSHEVRA